MNMAHWFSVIGTRKTKYWERNQSLFQFSKTKYTWTAVAAKLDLRGEKPVTIARPTLNGMEDGRK